MTQNFLEYLFDIQSIDLNITEVLKMSNMTASNNPGELKASGGKILGQVFKTQRKKYRTGAFPVSSVHR